MTEIEKKKTDVIDLWDKDEVNFDEINKIIKDIMKMESYLSQYFQD